MGWSMTKRACLSLMLQDGPGMDERRWRRTRGIYHRSVAACTMGPGAEPRVPGEPRQIGRMFDPVLTTLVDAATLQSDILAPTKEPEPEMRAA